MLERQVRRQAVGAEAGDQVGRGVRERILLVGPDQASGVMMIPIPEAGVLKRVDGVDDAANVPGVEGVEITAKINYSIAPLPEGDSYLGFIFARGSSPEEVESSLRVAHAKLTFDIAPEFLLLGA